MNSTTTTKPIVMLAGNELAEFTQLVRDYCASWSTETGEPNFEQSQRFYATDSDIIYYDNGLPRDGYRGWTNLKAGLLNHVYPNLSSLKWTPWEIWAQRRGRFSLDWL